jgi:hypothetical protein
VDGNTKLTFHGQRKVTLPLAHVVSWDHTSHTKDETSQLEKSNFER